MPNQKQLVVDANHAVCLLLMNLVKFKKKVPPLNPPTIASVIANWSV